mgnify:CR=1 FL=1
MKKLITLILLTTILTNIIAQKKTKVEVLFFKADLSCCMKRACDQLYSDIQNVIKETYPQGNVILKEIKISDPQNKQLVDKYKAINETVIVVANKKKKIFENNVTQIVANYKKTKNTNNFKKEFCEIINKYL